MLVYITGFLRHDSVFFGLVTCPLTTPDANSRARTRRLHRGRKKAGESEPTARRPLRTSAWPPQVDPASHARSNERLQAR
jgi:hypothetical protein